jgi:hypothetical protein
MPRSYDGDYITDKLYWLLFDFVPGKPGRPTVWTLIHLGVDSGPTPTALDYHDRPGTGE